MKDIAPEVFRQRLLLEGFFHSEINKNDIDRYLREVAEHLGLRIYAEPIIFSPGRTMAKKENQGFDAFVPLVDSGISLYVWSEARFFSIVIYSCKGFDETGAIEFTRSFFQVSDKLAHMKF